MKDGLSLGPVVGSRGLRVLHCNGDCVFTDLHNKHIIECHRASKANRECHACSFLFHGASQECTGV